MGKETIIGLGVAVVIDIPLAFLSLSGVTIPRSLGITIACIGAIAGIVIIVKGVRVKDITRMQGAKTPQEVIIELVNKASDALKEFRTANNREDKNKAMAEFEKIRQSFTNSAIDRRLSNMLEYELWCNEFEIDYYSDPSIVIRDKFYRDIRDYVINNTKRIVLACLASLAIVVLAVITTVIIGSR